MPVMNITGNMSGAFSLGDYLYKTISDGAHFSMHDMKFTASASNSVYSGSSVQSKAFQILIIIKVWKEEGCNVEFSYIELPCAALKETVVARQFASSLASLIDV